jgi:predicted TIM-barrel fold metal-dependent hydrolase
MATSERLTTETKSAKGTRLRIVDTDLHPAIREMPRSLYPFMPMAWRRRFELLRSGSFGLIHPLRYGSPGHRSKIETIAPEGGPPASDPRFVANDHLDRYNIDCAIMSSLEAGALAQFLAGPDEANVLCQAINDYYIHEWLAVDPRYRYVICVSPQDPVAAAAEIRRVGAQRGVVGVYLPIMDTLIGKRTFNPIYDAAAEQGLPIYLHVTGAESSFRGAPTSAGGPPETYAEMRLVFSQIAESNLASLIFAGTFERYPTLKFAFVEFTFAWALPFIWKMDTNWRWLRMQTPWVKRLPSEYVRERVRFSTQPMDEISARDLSEYVRMLGPECLLFSTDYPHWDGDQPTRVFQTLPEVVRAQIFAGNAEATFPL